MRKSVLSALIQLEIIVKKKSNEELDFDRNLNQGICAFVANFKNCGGVDFIDLFIKYKNIYPERYSGHVVTPVLNPDCPDDQWKAFFKYPHWTGAYGENRRHLLRFLIEEGSR